MVFSLIIFFFFFKKRRHQHEIQQIALVELVVLEEGGIDYKVKVQFTTNGPQYVGRFPARLDCILMYDILCYEYNSEKVILKQALFNHLCGIYQHQPPKPKVYFNKSQESHLETFLKNIEKNKILATYYNLTLYKWPYQ